MDYKSELHTLVEGGCEALAYKARGSAQIFRTRRRHQIRLHGRDGSLTAAVQTYWTL